MKCPCIECPEQGCGLKHDTCKEYLDFTQAIKNEHKGINSKRQFMRHLWMPTKGQRGYTRKYKGAK